MQAEPLTAEALYAFSETLLSSRYDSPQPTPKFHYELWKYCCSDAKQVAIGAPRGHAKSTAVTQAYTLASVLFRQADFVIIISDTETQAISFLNNIKTELYDNQPLRQLFKVGKFTKDSEKEIIVQMGDDGHKFKIMVRGASGGSGSVRGFIWNNKRPNLIVCDDMENDEAVLNEERRAKFREWFYGALIPSLSDYGKIRIVGTVLHFDSLLERLMPPTTGDKAQDTITEGLKQYSSREDTPWKAIKYRAHTDFDDFSELLWPEKFDEKRLRGYRDDYIAQGYDEGYSQEYLNYPMAPTVQFFRRKDFIPMEQTDYTSFKHYYAAIDLAISTKDKRSWTVIVIGGVDEHGYLHLVDLIRQRMDGQQIIDAILDMHERYHPEIFAIEKGALEKSIGAFLKSEMLRTNIFPNMLAIAPTADKRSRARAIQGRMRQGAVKFDVGADWFPGFEEELMRFDKGDYDDQVDAFAYLGLLLNSMIDAPTEDELDEMEYEEEFNKTSGQPNYYGGRSATTGY